jgi:phosphatidylglycerophosphate synthase
MNKKADKKEKIDMLSIPNLITIFRIVAILFIALSFFLKLHQQN